MNITKAICSCIIEYKNLSWVWGWNSKICSEDYRFASRACWVMTNGNLEGQIFPSTSHKNNGSLSCSPLNSYFKISFQKFLNTLRCNITWWRHFEITVISLDYYWRSSITQLRACLIKIVTFKGGHLMWQKCFHAIRNCSKRKDFSHSGSKFFPLRGVLIMKRDAIEENHCL